MSADVDLDIDGDAIAAEVVLLRAAAERAILIVEGWSDDRLFRKFLDSDNCELVIAHGKENALRAIELLERNGFEGVLALVDLDYDGLRGEVRNSDHIVYTEEHDVECMLVKSRALDSVLMEFGSRKKLESLRLSGVDVREILLNAVRPIGVARYISLSEGIDLTFKGINYKIIDKKKLVVSEESLVKELYNNSGRHRSKECELVKRIMSQEFEGLDPWVVCCGHDVVAALVKALQHVLGSHNSGSFDVEALEAHLRLAYDSRDFAKSKIFQYIRAWEGRNLAWKFLDNALH